MAKRRARKGWLWALALAMPTAVGLYAASALRPTAPGPATTFRIEKNLGLSQALGLPEVATAVRDRTVWSAYANLKGQPPTVTQGTYRVRPGMTPDELFRALRNPIRQMVRLPEGWWIARTAKRLEEMGVCRAEEYVKVASQPERFRDSAGFPLPSGSLEGYLFPDTYDLPPLLGAEAVVRRQLDAFAKRAAPLEPDPEKLRRAVIVASLVELEAGVDEERAKIAGVIENRLARKMRLEIDATVLYALQEWKQLGPGVVRTVQSPFNTYLNFGLPPGPIGSPGLKSLEAALKPDQHGYLFYVARPDRTHYFARTYEEHRSNIRRARLERQAQGNP
jgi:UPF0755 protein